MPSPFKSMGEYDSASNHTLDILFDDLECLNDNPTAPAGFDVELSVSSIKSLFVLTD